LLDDLGGCLRTGMGSVPLSWVELTSWQNSNGLSLQPWELRAIRLGSEAYVNEGENATDNVSHPPYPQLVEVNHEKLQENIRSILQSKR